MNLESLKAMCEAFLVVRKLKNLSTISFKMDDRKLKLKKPKILSRKKGTIFRVNILFLVDLIFHK